MSDSAIFQPVNSFYIAELKPCSQYNGRPDIRWNRCDFISIDQALRDPFQKRSASDFAKRSKGQRNLCFRSVGYETYFEPELGQLRVHTALFRGDTLPAFERDFTATPEITDTAVIDKIAERFTWESPRYTFIHAQKTKPTAEDTQNLRRDHDCVEIVEEAIYFRHGLITRGGPMLHIAHQRLASPEKFWKASCETKCSRYFPLSQEYGHAGYMYLSQTTIPYAPVYQSEAHTYSGFSVSLADLPSDAHFPLRALHEREVKDFARKVRTVLLGRNRAKRKPQPA